MITEHQALSLSYSALSQLLSAVEKSNTVTFDAPDDAYDLSDAIDRAWEVQRLVQESQLVDDTVESSSSDV